MPGTWLVLNKCYIYCDGNEGEDDDTSGFCCPKTLFLTPRYHAASHCFLWDVRRGKRGSNTHGAERTLLPISLCSAVGCLWQTGARIQVMASCESLTLVVIGSDDLGLLRVLLLRQVSYLRKTERPAVTTGITVEFPPAELGAVYVCKKGRLMGAKLIPGLALTYAHSCAQPTACTHRN